MPKPTIKLSLFLKKHFLSSYDYVFNLIQTGKVTVNNIPPNKDVFISPYDQVKVSDDIIQKGDDYFYYAYHKPIGVECTLNTNTPDNLINATGINEYFFPVGRLDKHSEGLLLLTNDGWFYKALAGKETGIEKEYHVTVNLPLQPDFVSQMENGLVILGKPTLPCQVSIISPTEFLITLKEGRNRQIRRMCAKLGYEVVKLKRIRMHHILLANIPVGEYESISSEKIKEVLDLLE
ncbi:MAG: pseudouridine synthase [Cytophagaceae bacterium]